MVTQEILEDNDLYLDFKNKIKMKNIKSKINQNVRMKNISTMDCIIGLIDFFFQTLFAIQFQF
jgi:hypothetical protein